MDQLWQDLKFGIRAMWRSPGFAVVSITTLALAIAVNTAIFSIVSVIVFADLPMQEQEEIAVVRALNPGQGITRGAVSYADFLDMRDQATTFESMAAMGDAQWVMSSDDSEPLRVTGQRISANMIDLWGLTMTVGRSFLPGEDVPGAEPVVILAHGFWQRSFGARTDVVGSTLRLDGEEHTVIGVMDPEMEFAELADAEVWVPARFDRESEARDERSYYVTGRLVEGTTHAQATEEMNAISTRLVEEHPFVHAGWNFRSGPVTETLVDDTADTIILFLSLTVAFVLMIACANVANMLLARATARGRELAVRAALGARRIRVVRQLLTESLVIAVLASALGLALAKGLLEVLILISAGRERVFMMAEMNTRVLFFTLGVTLMTPLLFGLLPALMASSEGLTQALKEGSARAGGRGGRTRALLVGGQISLAIMLMVVAGLIIRSEITRRNSDLGFDPAGLIAMELDLPSNRYGDQERVREFYAQLSNEILGFPGAQGVELASAFPTINLGRQRTFEIDGQPISEGQEPPFGFFVTASPGYLDLAGVPIMRGRGLTRQDTDETFDVAVVSQAAAGRYWADREVVGERFRIGTAEASPWIQIVGVARDIRSARGNEEPDPLIYVPFAQDSPRAMVVLARAGGDPSALGPTMREAVWSVDSEQPVDDLRTAEAALSYYNATDNALISLFVTFAGFALFMSAIGIYGVMSYSVSQRAGEISIRRALGAESGDVRRMVLGQGVRILAFGGAVGLVGAFLLSRLLSSLVYGISTTDPVTFIGVPIILGVVALLANYLPALQATRIDPMRALRVE
jgi:putative ABC transport system permease protein